MLTRNQLEQISSNFQIDSFSVFREYLQLVFLNELYKEKQAEKIYFKGGTCLHLLYGSSRFSEDLDFSTELSKKTLKDMLGKIIKKLQIQIPQARLIFVWQGKKTVRYRLKFRPQWFKYPLNIRLDFSFEKLSAKPNVLRIRTEIPISISSLILCLKEEEILAEKIRAFLVRAKGRDVFDLWHLLDKQIEVKQSILQKKLKAINLSFSKQAFLGKIKKYSIQKIERDLAKFLPRSQRKIIPLLQEKILAKSDCF